MLNAKRPLLTIVGIFKSPFSIPTSQAHKRHKPLSVLHQEGPHRSRGSCRRGGEMGKAAACKSVCVCVITLSVPVSASITAIVVQVWTEDRSSSVCPPGLQTHMPLSAELGKGSHQPPWLVDLRSSLILHRQTPF